jgi:predicted aspartyl protease
MEMNGSELLLLTSRRFKQALPYSVAAILAALTLLAILTLFTSPNPLVSPSELDSIARQFCVPAPLEARVSAAQAAAIELHVAVPDETPAVNASSKSVVAHKGEVVRIAVESNTGGAVGVHGMSDVVPIRSGQTVNLAFRLIYSGRFPVHFHGVNGSHFEILALEIHD